ncbi:hypothetical protein ACFVT5_27550 [Streptomyces sp. NPDC058001]|uniref:hypothetical protein n=1 Tax=Streptomyces sp. NPDC058001 TaxID=3346300 RepID=UPI0036E2FEF0
MTDLFSVSVDFIQGATLRGRVHLINPDAPFVPEEATFPLALLTEAWFALSSGFLSDGDGMPGREDRYPGSALRGRAIEAGVRRADEYREIFDLIMGEKVRTTHDGYLLADDGRTVLAPRRLAKAEYGDRLDTGGGHDGISRYVRTRSRPDEFGRRAAEVVTSYTLGPLRNVPLWSEVAAVEDPDEPWEEGEREAIADLTGTADLSDWQPWVLISLRPLDQHPYREITVTVRDPDYLEHLVTGMRWSTTHTGYV